MFQLHNWRSISRTAKGEDPGPVGSINKLWWSEMSKRLHDTAMAVRRPGAAAVARRRRQSRRRRLAAVVALLPGQLDLGRHERDPAQRHRRTHARAAARAQKSHVRNREPPRSATYDRHACDATSPCPHSSGARLLVAGLVAVGSAAAARDASASTSDSPRLASDDRGGESPACNHDHSSSRSTSTPVKAGATVTVKNKDTVDAHRHVRRRRASTSIDVEDGTAGTFTAPTKPGDYKFHCNIHSSMNGIADRRVASARQATRGDVAADRRCFLDRVDVAQRALTSAHHQHDATAPSSAR